MQQQQHTHASSTHSMIFTLCRSNLKLSGRDAPSGSLPQGPNRLPHGCKKCQSSYPGQSVLHGCAVLCSAADAKETAAERQKESEPRCALCLVVGPKQPATAMQTVTRRATRGRAGPLCTSHSPPPFFTHADILRGGGDAYVLRCAGLLPWLGKKKLQSKNSIGKLHRGGPALSAKCLPACSLTFC